MKKLSALAFSTATYLSLAFPVLAVDIDPCASSGLKGKQNAEGFGKLCNISFTGGLVSDIITIAFILASLIALGFLIYGGIRWITSGGDKTGVETARNTIVAALVGLVIVFLAYFIIKLIFGFFGLDFGTFALPKFTD